MIEQLNAFLATLPQSWEQLSEAAPTQITLAAAFVAGVAALVASLVTSTVNAWTARTITKWQIGAQYDIAWRNRDQTEMLEIKKVEANRGLEEERAHRELRRQRVQPLLTFAERRYLMMMNQVEEAFSESESPEMLPVPEENAAFLISSLTVANARVLRAFERFTTAYRVAQDWPHDGSVTDEQVIEVREALRELTDAADRYIVSG